MFWKAGNAIIAWSQPTSFSYVLIWGTSSLVLSESSSWVSAKCHKIERAGVSSTDHEDLGGSGLHACCFRHETSGLGGGTLSQCHLIQLSANIGSHVKLSFSKFSLAFQSSLGFFVTPSLNWRKNLTHQVVGSVFNSCLNLVRTCLKSLVIGVCVSFVVLPK